ncbi:thioredoxin domain-containing protein [Sulfurimonas sp. MAG313]|nr:thioredoxin domain-containing protein [Sulfurimonas sp. MAG313]MDF1882148.1 thioredoxin domain-containing protein [Sulfurimonas sp. MAG313]
MSNNFYKKHLSLLSSFVLVFLLATTTYASDEKILSFFKENIKNSKIMSELGLPLNKESINVSIVTTMKLQKPKNWTAYLIEYKTKTKTVYKSFYIGDGIMSTRLFDMNTGEEFEDPIALALEFNANYYDEEHLIYGNKNAKHKIVIFADPLCVYCRTAVPEAIKYMRKYPNTFAVYHFYFPMLNASSPLLQASIAARMKGKKNIYPELYEIDLDYHEFDLIKIVDAFNKNQDTKIGLFDIMSPQIQKALQKELKVAREHLITGTPSFFVDGKKDPSKVLYKKMKIVQ